jgi:hypothetical protein
MGLNVLTRHKAVRDGDGPAMVADWKVDLLSFWTHGHSNYLQIGHQFLASM